MEESGACDACGYTTLARIAGPADFDPFESFLTDPRVKAADPTMSSARSQAPAGRLVAGRYQLLELVGEGGMGKVYKALHLALDKVVCLKMLRAGMQEDPAVVRRFQREAKSASRLRHPNSIQVLDFGVDQGAMYLAMEFVDGKDLREVLKEEFPLPEERTCRIIAQALSALAEAHAAQVIHRDLKPDNIMVERLRDGGDLVKVLDFGIAKILEPDEPGITAVDMICGTPQYMSPEQAVGGVPDGRSDLYAIGVILYQMTTAHLPIVGRNPLDVLTKQGSVVPVPPRRRRPDLEISPELDALVMRALEKDPARRPQSAEEFRLALLAIADRAKAKAGARATNPEVPARADRPLDAFVLSSSLADSSTALLTPSGRLALGSSTLVQDLTPQPAEPRETAAPKSRLPMPAAERTMLIAGATPPFGAARVEPPRAPVPAAPAPPVPPPTARRHGSAPPPRDRPLIEQHLAPEVDENGLPRLSAMGDQELQLADHPRRRGSRTRVTPTPAAPPPSTVTPSIDFRRLAVQLAIALAVGAVSIRYLVPLVRSHLLEPAAVTSDTGAPTPTAPPADPRAQ